MLVQHWPNLRGLYLDDEQNDVGPMSWSYIEPTKYIISTQR